MAESMGHLFETITAFPELRSLFSHSYLTLLNTRSLFFRITSKSHFFPNQLDPESNTDLLVWSHFSSHTFSLFFQLRMCKAFTPNEQKCFTKTLVYKHTLQLLMCELSHSMLHNGEKKDQIFAYLTNFLPDHEKTKQHFQKLLEIKDKKVWKLLTAICGFVESEKVRSHTFCEIMIIAELGRFEKGVPGVLWNSKFDF